MEQIPQRHKVTYLEDLILQPLSVLSLLFVIFSIHPNINISSPLPLLFMQDLGLFQDPFSGFSISRYFSPASETHFQIIFSIVQLFLPCFSRGTFSFWDISNPLNAELNPICYLLALLGAHHFLYVSGIRVKLLTFRLLMSYIYGAPTLDVSRSHTTTNHSR